MKKLCFLSGLPRTGSTLLGSILNQNLFFHFEQTSPLCRILWSLKQCFDNKVSGANTEFFASYRTKKDIEHLFWSVVNSYYKNANSDYIFDKHISWTIEANYKMITDFLDVNPKIIVTTRNFEDVVKSFVQIYLKNGLTQNYAENDLLNLNNASRGILLRPVAGIIWVQFNKNKSYHIVDYDNLISNPQKEIIDIYNFLSLPIYEHNYDNINCNFLENNDFYSLKNVVEVRNKISKRKLNINLSENCLEKIKNISELIEISKKNNILDYEVKKIKNFYIENIDI
jgi:sulfotransferase